MQHHPRLSEAKDKYLAMRRARFSKQSAINDGYALTRFLAWVGEDIQVRNLQPERVEAFFYGPGGLRDIHETRDGKTRPAVQESTHNHIRSRLKMFFAYCTQNGWLRQDLLLQVTPMRRPRKQRFQPAPRILLAMLDATTNPRDRAYIAVAINTAMRSNEIARLRVGDVDLDAGDLTVWISKSKTEDTMPISSDLDAELRIWLTQYALDIERPLGDDDYLFPARRNSVYVWRKNEEGEFVRGRTAPSWQPGTQMVKTHKVVQRALEVLGENTMREGTHTIRRAVARAYFDGLVAEGYDFALRATSALLHHNSASTTEAYLGLSSERQVRDDFLRGKPFLSAMVSDENVKPLRREA